MDTSIPQKKCLNTGHSQEKPQETMFFEDDDEAKTYKKSYQLIPCFPQSILRPVLHHRG